MSRIILRLEMEQNCIIIQGISDFAFYFKLFFVL